MEMFDHYSKIYWLCQISYQNLANDIKILEFISISVHSENVLDDQDINLIDYWTTQHAGKNVACFLYSQWWVPFPVHITEWFFFFLCVCYRTSRETEVLVTRTQDQYFETSSRKKQNKRNQMYGSYKSKGDK